MSNIINKLRQLQAALKEEHERRFETMDFSFTKGLQDLKTSIEKKEEKKENHVWDIILVLLNSAILVFIAMKIH